MRCRAVIAAPRRLFSGLIIVVGLVRQPAFAAEQPPRVASFIEGYCSDCHDTETAKGGLDLTTLSFDPANPSNFARWVKVFDRVTTGEMPPKKSARPDPQDQASFTSALLPLLTTADEHRIAQEGRATQRRLNRYEYENALRDLLQAPWLQVKDQLPEDEEAHRFNKIGTALDVSYVNLQYYLAAADQALREVIAAGPPTRTTRYYARDEASFVGPMRPNRLNTAPERATFPVLGTAGQPLVRSGAKPMTVGASDADVRDREAVGTLAEPYEPIEPAFNGFRAPVGGHYRIRLNAFSVWVGPGPDPKAWWVPNLDEVSPGHRDEPIMLYAQSGPRKLRWLGNFDATPAPAAHEMEVWLQADETIRPDAARLFRTAARAGRFRNPLAEKTGQPGVAYRWLEVEGPIYDATPTPGLQLLFGDLPVRQIDGRIEAMPNDPLQDAARLIRNFVDHAYRRPVGTSEWHRFLPVVEHALASGSSFTDAMLEGYSTVLISPEFLCLREEPGRLDDYALASRLSFFLWNSPPDDELRRLAIAGRLHHTDVLRAQTERMLNSPKAQRFIDAFLDYWLDLRNLNATSPDIWLYPDYFGDDLLIESARAETHSFFAELVRENLPARNLVASNFVMVNERLAEHYGLPGVHGVALRKVILPSDSPRGGLLTQAAVLKVTANGTTTSPVQRGVWVLERILGTPSQPKPKDVPVLEPDTRGATTIRLQLAKHRASPSCAACHAQIDPLGFALESFDVLGGWRDRYRALSEKGPTPGIGRDGAQVFYYPALPVDCTGNLPDGRTFTDVRELKRLLLTNQPQIARNLVQQLILFATGAPIGFSDRAKVDRILAQASADDYGVRSLIREIVESDLFRCK